MTNRLEIEAVEQSAPMADWDDLVRRSGGNVFMHPAAAAAARAAGFSSPCTLLAWDRSHAQRKLVGLWTLARAPRSAPPARGLSALPFEYAFVSNPVVDTAHLDTVIPAFLGAIEKDPHLGRTLHIKHLDASAPSGAALLAALSHSKSRVMPVCERERPYVTREAGQKLTGSTRKKLRQDWNRLGSAGNVEIANERSPGAVQEALEVFLTLEAASWKGKEGTALACRPDDVRFVRELVGGLARAGAASVALLKVDSKPIAAQVLLYCGATAYTWKTAFDAGFSKFSPGALLVDQLTQSLLSPEGGMEAIESCSPEGGFMEQLWSGRRTTVELVVDLGPRTSLGFLRQAVWHRGRAGLKSLRSHGLRAGAPLIALMSFLDP
jgi:CelD/BcsL family acetyltransferase involved in cellulose biosynthesis